MTGGADEPLLTRCACGARVRVPPARLGRKGRCPRCQRVFVLKPLGRHAARASGASGGGAEPSSPWPVKIRFRCACGAALSVPASHAGRKARCARCGRIIDVPLAGAGDTDALLAGLAKGEPVSVPAAPPAAAPGRSGGRPSGDIGSASAGDAPAGVTRPVKGEARVCPCCRRSWSPGTVICTDCGIDLRTGRALLTTQDENLDQICAYTEGILRWLSWIVWSGLYPIASEAFGLRKPWVVRGLALATTLVSIWFMVAYIYSGSPDPDLKNLMLWSGAADRRAALAAQGLGRDAGDSAPGPDLVDLEAGRYQPRQLVTHAFLHAGPMHLAGNMLFLLVLGSRVNALIGNILTAILYPLLAIAAGAAHMATSAGAVQHPMLGASGAVMGLAGMYLILFPTPKVHMVFWWRWGLIGGFRLQLKTFAVRGFWVVLFCIAFDVIYTVFGLEDQVAHWAHLGGFLAGAGLALLLLFSRLVNARGGDLVSAVLGRYAWQLLGKPNRRTLALW